LLAQLLVCVLASTRTRPCSAIAQQGAALGGTVFATFDRKAVATLAAAGFESTDPAELVE